MSKSINQVILALKSIKIAKLFELAIKLLNIPASSSSIDTRLDN